MSYTLQHGRIDTSNAAMQCQLCLTNLDRLSVSQREQHYEKHFKDEPEQQPEASSSKRPQHQKTAEAHTGRAGFSKVQDFGRNFKFKTPNFEKDKDKFWYPAQTAAPPSNFTPGLIPLLKKHIDKSHKDGYTRRAVLCYERAVLVNRELFDAGWGCGYRNFMMACVSLMDQEVQPLYFPLLDHPIPPGVRNLQQWIEDAWEAGFDPDGAKELKSLVESKKWLGTSDLLVAFTHRGIPAKLVDFDLKENQKGADLLTDWIVEYFSHPDGFVDTNKVTKDERPKTINDVLFGASAVTLSPRMPLILQHAGHSRTIVGYELSKKGTVNLLEFDPSKIPKKSLRRMGLDVFASMHRRHENINTRTNSVASSSSTKRSATSQNNPIPLKRSRVDNEGYRTENEGEDDDDEIQIISVTIRNENTPGHAKPTSAMKGKEKDGEAMSTRDILNFFRLDPKKLERRKAYQVLYFPMTAPLSDSEKNAMRNTPLFCEKIS